MTILEKNRLVGVAFLVVAFFHLATLAFTLFGFSLTYPYVGATDTTFSKLAEKAGENTGPTPVEPVVPGIPGISGMPGAKMTPAPAPETKAQIEAKRTMTMIYVLVGVQIAILIFILFAGFTVVNVRAGGRSLGIVASIFLVFFYPLGTVVSILAVWFLTGDDCLELYSDIEKDKRSAPSII